MRTHHNRLHKYTKGCITHTDTVLNKAVCCHASRSVVHQLNANFDMLTCKDMTSQINNTDVYSALYLSSKFYMMAC